jgi:hypothetical protein
MDRMRAQMREGSRVHRALIPGIVVAFVMTACGGTGAGAGSPSVSVTPTLATRPSSTGVLTIVTPTNGQVITGSNVSLKVDLTGATLVQMTSTDLKPDQGHLHVILDDTLITMTSGLETVIPNVPPGKHLIKVEFVANDHAPFDPRVIVGVAFTVKA